METKSHNFKGVFDSAPSPPPPPPPPPPPILARLGQGAIPIHWYDSQSVWYNPPVFKENPWQVEIVRDQYYTTIREDIVYTRRQWVPGACPI